MPQINIDNLPSNNNHPVRNEGPIAEPTNMSRSNRVAAGIADLTGGLYESVILPAIKGIISDLVTSGMDQVLGGGHQQTRGRRTDYSRISTQRRAARRSTTRRRPRARNVSEDLGLNELNFSSRREAEDVLGMMYEYIDSYQWCSVSDLYSFVNWDSTADSEYYGWASLTQAKIRPNRGTYFLSLPEPISQ